MFDNFDLTGKNQEENAAKKKASTKLTCPKSTAAIAEASIKLGERIADIKLYPYQIKFARRMVESLLLEDAETITALFARQCVDPNQVLYTSCRPLKMSDAEPDSSISDNSKGYFTYDNKVTDKWTANVSDIYEITNHQKQSIIASDMHRFRLGDGQWGYVSDNSLNEDSTVSYMIKHICDDTPANSVAHNDMFGMFASQLFLNGKKTPMILDKTFKLMMQIHPQWVKEFSDVTKFHDLVQTPGYYLKTVPLEPGHLEQVINFGFVNRLTTLKYIMKQATIEQYHNNRKKVYRIALPYSSSGPYEEYLYQFLKQLGIAPIKKDDNRIIIDDFESLILCFQVLDPEAHFFYTHLRDYLVGYYLRNGYKIHYSHLFKVFKEFPGLKSLIKNSLFAHYRSNGMGLATLIQLFMKKGIPYSEYFHVLPNLVASPIKSIKRLPLSNQKFVDIETSTTFNVINGFVTHNSGKTEAISVVCDACMVLFPFMAASYPDDSRLKKFKHGLWVGIFAPSLDQSKTTFDRMRSRLASNNGHLILKEFGLKFETNRGDTIQLTNGSFTRCMTASETSHIESKTFHMAVCEESQDISPFKLKKSIQPMLSSTAGTLVMIGTANTTKNHLLDMTEYNKRRMLQPGERQNHFEVDYLEACRFNPKYAKHITKEIDRLGGVDSDEFKMSYRNIFCLERGMAFDPRQLEIYHEKDNPMGCFEDYETVQYYHGKRTVCIGIDVGKSQDSTVLTAIEVDFEHPIETHSYIAYTKRLIGWLELIGDDFNAQFFQIYEYLERMQAQIVYMDTTGKGDVLYDRVMAAVPGIDVMPYVFSRPSKSRLYKALMHDVASRRIILPAGKNTVLTREYQRFYQQMSELEKEYHGEFLDCHKPAKKGRGDVPHDDFCVVGGTLLQVFCDTSKNYTIKRIEDVVVGDKVLTHKGRWMPVTKTYKRATTEPIVTLRITGQGLLRLTGNHPVHLEDGSFVASDSLAPGDFVSLCFPQHGSQSDYLSLAQEDYIQILGYFLAAGKISLKGKGVTFKMAGANLAKFEKDLTTVLRQVTKKAPIVTPGEKRLQVSSIDASLAADITKDYASVTDVNTKTIPKMVLEGGPPVISAFLTAYMSYAAVCESTSIAVTVENKILAYQLRDLLFRMGIISFVEAPFYRAEKIRGPVDTTALTKQNFYVVKIADRDYIQKAINLFGIPTRKKYANIYTDDDLYHRFVEKGTRCSFVIESVETSSTKVSTQVFNLEVSEDHSYTLLKATVHNCDSLALACWSARQESVYNVEEVDSPFIENGRNSFLNR
jgi:hypothetical protein